MVTVERLSRSDRVVWNEHVERSDGATPFHRFEALEVIANHTETELLPLVGHKGQEPTALFPVFVKELPGCSIAYSPPPHTDINYLGPTLLNVEALRQRKRTSRNWHFVDEALEQIEVEISPRSIAFQPPPGYDDVRPFTWSGFEARPLYTFEVDIGVGPDDLLRSFSRDARTNIQSNGNEEIEVREGGVEDLRRTLAQVERVYRDQNRSYPGEQLLVVDLFRRLDGGTCRTYVCTIDGEFAGGAVTVETDDTIYRWQAGADLSHSVAIYERIDWHIMTDAMDRGIEWYDLMGADRPSLSEYKAKFDPHLRSHYALKRQSPAFAVASKGVQVARNRLAEPLLSR